MDICDNVASQNIEFVEDLEESKRDLISVIDESEKVLRKVCSGERLLPRSLDHHDAATLK